MKYYISDLHFFHENIISIDGRDFKDVTQMNEYMISQWNSRVNNCDDVYILGDFSVGSVAETEKIISQLNGNKYLLIGNHDDYLHDKAFNRQLFNWVKPYKEIKDAERKVVLSHYPIFCYNGQNRSNKDGTPKTYMLYGHVHNADEEKIITKYIDEMRRVQKPDFNGVLRDAHCNMVNCFCANSDYIPLTLDEWIIEDQKRRNRILMGD